MSIFYNHRRFNLSLRSVQAYIEITQENDKEGDPVDQAVRVLTGFCGVVAPAEEDLDYFVERIQGLAKEMEDLEGESKPSRKNPSFGSSYQTFLQGADVETTIFRMTGYNYDQSKIIYCKMDRDDALSLVRDYLRHQSELNLVSMESSMYGFGGSYKKDTQEKASNVVNLETKQGVDNLRQFGF
jgi:hypothetical protein